MANDDNTQIITREGKVKESSIFGVSIRGWIGLILAVTLCFREIGKLFIAGYISISKNDLSLLGSQISIDEPFYSISVAVMAYYFAKMTMSTVKTKE